MIAANEDPSARYRLNALAGWVCGPARDRRILAAREARARAQAKRLARADALADEALMAHRAMRLEKTRVLLLEAREKTGAPLHEMIGPNKRKTWRAIAGRDHVIAALYDPATAGDFHHGTKWGISRIGRLLDMDHTSILACVRRLKARGVL